MKESLFAAIVDAATETPQQRHARLLSLARRHYVSRRESIPTAAASVGVTADELVGLLEELGIERRNTRPRRTGVRRTPAEQAALEVEIIRDYKDGVSLNMIALRRAISKKRVRGIVEAAGMTIRPAGTQPKPLPPGTDAEIRRLHLVERLTYREIRDRLGVTDYRIHAALGEDARRKPGPRARKGEEPPTREEIEHLITRYVVDQVGLVRLARQEGWQWQVLRSLLVAEGVKIRSAGPVKGSTNVRSRRPPPP